VTVEYEPQPPAPFGGLAPDFATVPGSGTGLEGEPVKLGQAPLVFLEPGQVIGQLLGREVSLEPAHDLNALDGIDPGQSFLLTRTDIEIVPRRNKVQIVDEFSCRLLFLFHNRLS